MSEAKIDSGIYIGATSTNKVPAVVWIGNCTATAVSDNTLVTAAHCVEQMGIDESGKVNGQICVQSGAARGKCSDSLWMPAEYMSPPSANLKYKWDVAVGVFPRGTFANFFPVQTTAAAVGQEAVLVGYSDDNQTEEGKGSKRWGRNRVDELRGGVTIITSYLGSSDGVAVSPGDSGGPLFVGCKLTGVASRMSEGESGKISLHTNLTIAENSSWLGALEQKGGYICGVSGADSQRCASNGLAALTSNPAQENNGSAGFPCAPGTSTTLPPSLMSDLGAALYSQSGGVGLLLAMENAVSDLNICVSDSPNVCGSNTFTASFLKSMGGRAVLLSNAMLGVSPGQKAYIHVRKGSDQAKVILMNPK